MFRSNRPQCGPHIMTQLKRGDGDGANEDRVDEEDRPDEEDMADKEDRADEVQAEEDEGELVGMGNTLRMYVKYVERYSLQLQS